MNKLYYGDCLTVMEQEMQPETVDLIYLDPPFNSKRAYNAIYKDETGRPLPDQIEAFCDLWTLDRERRKAIANLSVKMLEHRIDGGAANFCAGMIKGLQTVNSQMAAYLSYMAERLLVMRDILKKTSSIFLHCDPTASHYIKIVMDCIFGDRNFQNEIVWSYRSGGGSKRRFGKKHDILFWYSKTKDYTFNADEVRVPYNAVIAKSRQDQFNEKGKVSGSVWDLSRPPNHSKEWMGYPTQKPLILLNRVIKAASNEGDLVLDPFCGCATTLEAAQSLKRRWIGIDIAIHAIKRVSAVRLNERCLLKEGKDYEIRGIPHNMEGATDLWNADRYHFQKWAIEQVDGFVTANRTRDGGMDGKLYFRSGDDLKSMAIEVKGGEVPRISDLRGVAGVIDRETILMAGLITRNAPSARQRKNFQDFCDEKGDVEIDGAAYPRLQFLSVPEILEGKRFNTPRVRGRRSSDQRTLYENNQ